MKVRLTKLQLGIYGKYEPIRCAVSNERLNPGAQQFSLGDNVHYVRVAPTHVPKVTEAMRDAWRKKVQSRKTTKSTEESE